MDHTTYKQTRDDTSVRKQIGASLFFAQQIHGNAADITRGRNEPWSLQFFYAKPKLFGIKQDVYGHVTDQMKQASAARMEQFIRSVNQ